MCTFPCRIQCALLREKKINQTWVSRNNSKVNKVCHRRLPVEPLQSPLVCQLTGKIDWGLGRNGPQFSSSLYSLIHELVFVFEHVLVVALHCHNIGLTSSLRFLILGTPSTDSIAKVRALVMYLSVIAHSEE